MASRRETNKEKTHALCCFFSLYLFPVDLVSVLSRRRDRTRGEVVAVAGPAAAFAAVSPVSGGAEADVDAVGIARRRRRRLRRFGRSERSQHRAVAGRSRGAELERGREASSVRCCRQCRRDVGLRRGRRHDVDDGRGDDASRRHREKKRVVRVFFFSSRLSEREREKKK